MSYFQPPDPPEDPRDEAERMEDYAKDIARNASNAVLIGELGSDYIHGNEKPFEPHPWVINAILYAIEHERKDSAEVNKLMRVQFEKELAEEQARNKLIQDAMAEDFAKKEVENMRAVVAGVMSAAWERRNSKSEVLSVTVDVEKMVKVWDRYHLESIPNDNGTVTFRLHRK